MKKLLLIALLCLTFIPMFAQNNDELSNEDKFIYCEIVGTQKFMSAKVNISIDFGQAADFSNGNRLRDQDGKIKIFNSMVDAMNWMGVNGWEFCQAYVVTSQNQSIYHWLLKLNTSELTPEELKKVMATLNTKRK